MNKLGANLATSKWKDDVVYTMNPFTTLQAVEVMPNKYRNEIYYTTFLYQIYNRIGETLKITYSHDE